MKLLALLAFLLAGCIHTFPACPTPKATRCLVDQVQYCSPEHHWMLALDCGSGLIPSTCVESRCVPRALREKRQ
jgi:hypothetical protein